MFQVPTVLLSNKTLCSTYKRGNSSLHNQTSRWVYVQEKNPCCWDLYAEEKFKGDFFLVANGKWKYANFAIKSLKRELTKIK